MARESIVLFALLLGSTACYSGRIVDVSTDGRTSIAAAAEQARPGDVIRVAPGVYKLTETVKLNRSGAEGKPIRIEPAGLTRPVLDFSAQPAHPAARGIEVVGSWWHIVGLEIVGAGDNGINITGHHNIIEDCVVHKCRDTGIQIHQPASHNLVLNCDSYRNVDAHNHGESADGFAAKFHIGPGNVFRGCRAWENSDDGYDLWKAPNTVRIENCLAFRNGINLWNIEDFAGDGNGFKLGGDFVAAAHIVVNCVAVDQPVRGFDQNNNTGPLTIENCTAIRCKVGFYLSAAPTDGRHVLKRNVSLDSPVEIAEGSIEVENHWPVSAASQP